MDILEVPVLSFKLCFHILVKNYLCQKHKYEKKLFQRKDQENCGLFYSNTRNRKHCAFEIVIVKGPTTIG